MSAKSTILTLMFRASFIILPLVVSSSSSQEAASTVYEVLPQYGLPKGLLPNSVQSYTLSTPSEGGRFVVVLDKPCYVQFDYLVYYDKEITGKLSYGSITDLKGIQVRKFLLWFNVDEIHVDLPPPSDFIYFQVGIINKKLDIDQFETVHSCRDGVSLLCGDGSSKHSLKLPVPADEVEMIVTE